MYYVYILSNKKYGTLYVGVTNDLIRRIFEHKEKTIKSFTKKYLIGNLVYYEEYSDIESAISREKEIKHWNRGWRVRLIEKENSERLDLYISIIE